MTQTPGRGHLRWGLINNARRSQQNRPWRFFYRSMEVRFARKNTAILHGAGCPVRRIGGSYSSRTEPRADLRKEPGSIRCAEIGVCAVSCAAPCGIVMRSGVRSRTWSCVSHKESRCGV